MRTNFLLPLKRNLEKDESAAVVPALTFYIYFIGQFSVKTKVNNSLKLCFTSGLHIYHVLISCVTSDVSFVKDVMK